MRQRAGASYDTRRRVRMCRDREACWRHGDDASITQRLVTMPDSLAAVACKGQARATDVHVSDGGFSSTHKRMPRTNGTWAMDDGHRLHVGSDRIKTDRAR